jgi:hypothetical protein
MPHLPPPEIGEDDLAWQHIYGRWAPLTPAALRDVLSGFERPWWIVGGYAVEAFTGVTREHEDIDVCIFLKDVQAFRAHLEPRYHLWSNDGGTFRFFDEKHPEPLAPLSQIWVRENASAPWIIDCILNPSVHGNWQDKRDREHVAPLDQVTWLADDGTRYLNPEIALFFKANSARATQQWDWEVAYPMLSEMQREWLDGQLERQQRGELQPAR